MTRAAAVTLVWALFVLAVAALAARATYTTDLSGFLPRRANSAERLLVEQLRTGPGAHQLLVAIEGGDAVTRGRVSAELANRLRADAAFAAVNNGDAAQLERDRGFLFEHRYLLSPEIRLARFSTAGLHAAITDSLAELTSAAAPLLKSLFTRDPTGEMLAILDTLDASHAPHTRAGVWTSADGARALLVVQTRAAGSDTDAQQAAIERVRSAFAAAVATLPPAAGQGLRLLLSGPPVWAVTSRDIIRSEVLRLSGLSTLLIAVLLFVVYRSLPALAFTLVPVVTGALAGIAAVALGFGVVHGITLGFGVTLIGEAVDYSIYLFVQQATDFRRFVWPTIRLGMLTSVCGFAALLPSAFPGLAQLGLYSIAGLLIAAAVTRYVLPVWLARTAPIRDLTNAGATLARLVAWLQRARVPLLLIPVLALGVLLTHRGPVWSHTLAVLSPIPAASQALDEQLRTDTGTADLRYVAVATARDREGALGAAQAVGERLTSLIERGVIAGFESPARYLPPLATQRARMASLPQAAALRTRLAEAVSGLPVSSARLEPFLADIEHTRAAPLLTAADLAGTSFERAVEALLVQGTEGWSALLPVSVAGSGDLTPAATTELGAAILAVPGAQLLDLVGEGDRLYGGYLDEALKLALAGLGAIVLLLLLVLRSPLRVVRVVAPLLLSVLTVAGLLVAAGRELTILHVVGMLLIVAVGSNYALFFDRAGERPSEGSPALTLASLAVANVATVIAFGMLATSSVPVLRDLGSTVAPGALLALLFAATVARTQAPQGDHP